MRTAPTFTPSPAALSSPRDKRESFGESKIPTISAASSHGITILTCGQSMPERLPTVQKERSLESPNAKDIPWLKAVKKPIPPSRPESTGWARPFFSLHRIRRPSQLPRPFPERQRPSVPRRTVRGKLLY